MSRTESQTTFLKKCVVLLLFFVATFPCQTLCNGSPGFKYSREANTHFQGHVNEKHEHGDGVSHPFREGHGHSSFHAHREHCSRKDVSQSDIKEIWLYSMGSTLFISVVPFLFLFIIPLDNGDEMKPRLKVILAFASGGLLGDAFLHLIPHASSPHQCQLPENSYSSNHSHNHDHSKDTAIGLWVLGGIITFLTVEKLVRLLRSGEKFSHGHSHGNITKPLKKIKPSGDETNENAIKNTKDKIIPESIAISGYLNLAADFAHNFTDGLAIGASYLAGNSIGVVTTLTILLHEVPHEIGDFAILIKSGCSRRKAMVLQLLTALGALSGNCLSLLGVGVSDRETPWVLPFTAGGFIYIATVNVLPELLEDSTKLGQSIKEICALLSGVIFMILIANFE